MAFDPGAETMTQFIVGMVVGICIAVIGFVVVDGRDDRNYERD